MISSSQADAIAEFFNNTLMENFKQSDPIGRLFTKPATRGKIPPYQFKTRARVFDANPIEDNVAKLFDYMQSVMLEGTKFMKEGCSNASDLFHSEFEPIKNSSLCTFAEDALFNGKYHYYELSELKLGYKMHDTVQDHIFNVDQWCTAVELPVYSEKEDRSGFIDIVRVWKDRIMIVDFKPNAHKEKHQKVLTQLMWYKMMLCERTGIDPAFIDCLYFDKDNCYKLKT